MRPTWGIASLAINTIIFVNIIVQLLLSFATLTKLEFFNAIKIILGFGYGSHALDEEKNALRIGL